MPSHSRYTVIDTAALPPGACWISKNPQGPMIDTGVDILFNERGRLYLSVESIKEMARVAGLFDKTDEQELEDHAIWNAGYAAGVKEDLSGTLGDSLDQLGFLVDTLRGFVAVDPLPSQPTTPEPEAVFGGFDAPEPKQSRNGGRSGQGNGANRKPRPAGLPAAPSNESFAV